MLRKIVLDSQRSQEPVFRTALEYYLCECCSLFLDWVSNNFFSYPFRALKVCLKISSDLEALI